MTPRSVVRSRSKELRPDQTDNSIVFSRFLYEAKITAQLEHPGIVPVYELGEGEAPYYTMRFVKGRTLSEAIRAFHKKRAAGEADPVETGCAPDGLRRCLSRRRLCPFARDHSPRPEGTERRARRLRRGHGARLGSRQAGRHQTGKPWAPEDNRYADRCRICPDLLPIPTWPPSHRVGPANQSRPRLTLPSSPGLGNELGREGRTRTQIKTEAPTCHSSPKRKSAAPKGFPTRSASSGRTP